ncbi:MAG: DUF6057 family protein [Sedimentisphaerales bacterium]|nr:DUF6057 family protein [Sedimentisphaerales bacterium]
MSWSVAGTTALTLLFFVLYYLYLWLVVDLRLIYHGGGVILDFPVFYRGWEFFRKSAFSPGGSVEYVSAFLGQFFYIGWAGALVATVQAWLLWLCIGSIFRVAGGRRLRLVCFAASILLLILYAGYIYPLGIAMNLLVAFGFVRLYMGTTSKRRPTDLLVFLALSIILYVIVGGAYLLFAMVCGVYELFLRRRPALGITFLLSSPIVAHIVSVFVFNVGVIDVFNDFMLHVEKDDVTIKTTKLTVVYTLYLLLPLTMVGLGLAELLRRSKVMLPGRTAAVTVSPKSTEKNGQRLPNRFTSWLARESATIFTSLLGFVAAALVAYSCHDSLLKTLITVDYYASNKMWRQVLEASARYPRNKFINYAVNRALYQTGRLADDMFSFEQHPTALLLSTEWSNPVGWWWVSDAFIDLGQMNIAESMLANVMDACGERPMVLRRLALVTMVKGDIGAARVYLGALSRTLFDAGWAREYLEKIESDPNLSTDEEVQQLRNMMPAIDRDFRSLNEDIFLDLLDKNRQNRMAFEYLMAFYLLTGRFDKFAGNLDRLDDFDYGRIPRVYEEAILLYSYIKKTKVELHGREISPESRERFIGFRNIYIGRYRTNDKAALKELARNYGDSYFFYCLYGRSGMKK